MKIVHWNISKKSQPPFAVKKFEDELFNNLIKIEKDWIFHRINRVEGFFGNTSLSWITYNTMNADIVHGTSQVLAPAIYFHKINKFILTVYDLSPLIYPELINDISVKIQWYLTPKAIPKMDCIVAISEFSKKELLRLLKIRKENVIVIHPGVDHDKYKMMNKKSSKSYFGLDPDEKHILVVSSNLPHKRMDHTQLIFKKIRNKRNDIKLIKAGYSQSLFGEGIINMSWVSEEEMPILYNAADVFLYTSEYEGFGLPVLEAMACGLPVVVKNLASLPEICGEPHEGVCYLPNNKNQIIDSIDEIIRMTEIEFNETNIKRSMNFSWEKTAKEYINIYKNIGVTENC